MFQIHAMNSHKDKELVTPQVIKPAEFWAPLLSATAPSQATSDGLAYKSPHMYVASWRITWVSTMWVYDVEYHSESNGG